MTETFERNEASELTIADTNQKTEYWNSFAKKHLPEIRLLFQGGKLWSKEGWRNIVEHSLPQGAAAEVLSDMLQFPEEEKQELIKNSICHDWDKRIDKKPEDFTNKDQKKASKLITKIKLNQNLLAATKPEFVNQIISDQENSKETPIDQLIMFYIDEITMGGGDNLGGFVSFETRLEETKHRYPELSPEHWDKEIRAGHIVQNRIFQMLREKGILIEKPDDLPSFITDAIEKKYKLK